ncbi:MAG TPA: hypothetical protein VKF37_09265 [Chloroflexota bacterium]|nr:hypothetical protein [Chloroflexota bacterium]
MFAGHYAASFALKRANPRIPLWLLFIAVQFIDVLWAVFILLGIEKARVVPGSPLDLYYMPYTHSLIGALAWAALAYVAFRLLPNRSGVQRATVALILAAGVFSHYVLDLIVHRADMALWDNTAKIGLGLWTYAWIAYALEAVLLVGGLWLYLRATTATTFGGRYGIIIFVAVLLLVNVAAYAVAPQSIQVAAIFNEVCYWVFAGIALKNSLFSALRAFS